MRAVVLDEPGAAESLQLKEVPDPEIGPTEVLVRNEFAGINFIDVYRRTGQYPFDFPHIPGIEGGGEVVAVGSDVDTVDVGDRVVWGWVTSSYAELVAVPADSAIRVPAGVDMATAVGAVIQGLTAQVLVDQTFEVRGDQDVLVHAAAGGLGLLLTQLASARGARVIGTVSKEEKEKRARAAGAAEVFRYDQLADITAELPPLVRELAPDGVQVVYDGVGRTTFDASLACLARGGLLTLVGQASGAVPPFDLQRLNSSGSLFVTRPNVMHFVGTRPELEDVSTRLFRAIEAGDLAVAIHDIYPLEDAASAHRDLEERRTIGKVLLRTGEAPDA